MSAERAAFVEIVLTGGTLANSSLEYFKFQFPADKKKIARLSFNQKMDWYGYQFQVNPYAATVLFSDPEFIRFWKWHMMIPIKFKRFYYKIKNWLFKKREFIPNIKKKMAKYSI